MQLCGAVNEYALEMLEGQMMQQDVLMSQLSQELDNGRLLRLLSRLIMVSEGNQTSLEPNWSETGQLSVCVCMHVTCSACQVLSTSSHHDCHKHVCDSKMCLWQGLMLQFGA